MSGLPTVGSNPTLSATNSTESEGEFRTVLLSIYIFTLGASLPYLMPNSDTRIIPLSWEEGNSLLTLVSAKELQKVMILYRLILVNA